MRDEEGVGARGDDGGDGPITFKQRCASLHYSNSTAELGSFANTLQGTPFCLSPTPALRFPRFTFSVGISSIFVPVIHDDAFSRPDFFFFFQPQQRHFLTLTISISIFCNCSDHSFNFYSLILMCLQSFIFLALLSQN